MCVCVCVCVCVRVRVCVRVCVCFRELSVALLFGSAADYFHPTKITYHDELRTERGKIQIDHTFSRGFPSSTFFLLLSFFFFFFSSFFLLERNKTSLNVHYTEIKTVGDEKDCNPHALFP